MLHLGARRLDPRGEQVPSFPLGSFPSWIHGGLFCLPGETTIFGKNPLGSRVMCREQRRAPAGAWFRTVVTGVASPLVGDVATLGDKPRRYMRQPLPCLAPRVNHSPVDTAGFVAEKILAAAVNEPSEQYMG